MKLNGRLHIATFSANYIEAIRDYGIGMELNHSCISEYLDESRRQELLENIRTDLVITGLEREINSETEVHAGTGNQAESYCGKIPSRSLLMHGPFTEIHPAAIDYKVRDLGMERLNQAYEVAKEFGIKKMVVHTGWLPFIYFKEYQAEKGAAFWQKFMADKPDDFTICVENVLEDEPLMMLSMMKKISDPRIGICLDVGHAHCMTKPEYPVEKWIEILGPYITHFHLHNNDGTGDSHSKFDLKQATAMDMESVLAAIEKHCSADVTMTIESQDSLSCLEWLREREYI